MREFQRKAVTFAKENNLDAPTEFRALDFISEAGEIIKDITKSADYGEKPGDISLKKDEIGDLLFSLFLLAEDLDIDAEEAFEQAMQKYEKRIDEKGDPGSE
ncbi:MAG: MazG nucleotide pyrophosphohydrolase domain-containing protein [Candidatus Nanohaloarchaea archaeon]